VTEHKLFEGDIPYVSTAAYHAERERAPHLEQHPHQGRLYRAADFVALAVADLGGENIRISDLGCGDGGLLSLIQSIPGTESWGYDFAPANAAGWRERGVTASALDVFGADWDRVQTGHVVVMTEVLEHLADPHGVLRRLNTPDGPRRLVCSSPWNEGPSNHDACHAWAWDTDGYRTMLEAAGWTVQLQEQVSLFQVVLAR
jgi:2-polyprenyl-3-methyl-5-hydroxy-6-metoxy-1,4-benzoquinol methylase